MASKSYVYRDYIYKEVKSKEQNNCKKVAFISPDKKETVGHIYSSDEESFHKSCQLVIDRMWKTRTYDLHSNFDLIKHKETYINYLEVIIMADGKVGYAVPSHQRKLEEVACLQKGISREELMRLCPKDMYLDYNSWLHEITGCISVWTDFYLGNPNEYQLDKLEELKNSGVYLGSLEPGFNR
jgi:hypothetical protein